MCSQRVEVNSKQSAIGVLIRTDWKEELAIFQGRPTAAFAPEDVNVLHQTVTEHSIVCIVSISVITY